MTKNADILIYFIIQDKKLLIIELICEHGFKLNRGGAVVQICFQCFQCNSTNGYSYYT